MKLEVRDRFLSRSEVPEGEFFTFTVLDVGSEQRKTKSGMDYKTVIVACKDSYDDIVKISCFESELTACIRKWGDTDGWKNQKIDCYNQSSRTGRSKWKIVPSGVEEVDLR